jgi:hypothetical protein
LQLPLKKDGKPMDTRTKEWYYEAVCSIGVIGIDEWVWTAYCCMDTFFGEEEWSQYVTSSPEGRDGPSGKTHMFPIWNPREYFLAVIHRRMIQATTEWSSLVFIFVERLNIYVSSSRSMIYTRQRIL